MRIHVHLFLLLLNMGINKTHQFVNHSKQTSVSQTFSLSLLCRSNTVGKVDISGLDMLRGPSTANIIVIIISVLTKLLSGLCRGQ